MTLLNAINEHFFLNGKLVLKGGTALNLFIFELPRLSVDIDLNFMFRVPLFPIIKMRSRYVGSRQTGDVLVLDVHELAAGKLSALFSRHASRDLFDAHQLLTKHSLNFDHLRLISLIYSGMGSSDWRKVSVKEISFERQELQMQLIPVLNQKFLKAQSNWLDWTKQLVEDCKNALCALFPLLDFVRNSSDTPSSLWHLIKQIESFPL